MECPTCDGSGRVRVIDREWSACANCENTMSREAYRCMHCGHPNRDNSGTVTLTDSHAETCPLCHGSRNVSDGVGQRARAVNRSGCFGAGSGIAAMLPGTIIGGVVGENIATGFTSLLTMFVGALIGMIGSFALPAIVALTVDAQVANKFNTVYAFAVWALAVAIVLAYCG